VFSDNGGSSGGTIAKDRGNHIRAGGRLCRKILNLCYVLNVIYCVSVHLVLIFLRGSCSTPLGLLTITNIYIFARFSTRAGFRGFMILNPYAHPSRRIALGWEREAPLFHPSFLSRWLLH